MSRRSADIDVPVSAEYHALADADVDLRACEQLMRGGSKSFFAASRVLPARVRAPATALYAFCRLADDTIDIEADQHGGSHGALAHLQHRLACIYRREPLPFDADRALACVVQRHAIPDALPLALLDGFAWDMGDRRYETLADLHDYAARVAGSVGAMMALIMGTRSAQALARACELGVAMQLTNIARDVGDDARLGRLYLPRCWMREAGLDPDVWLAEPRFCPALAGVVSRLLTAADALYHRAGLGIAELPRDCRPAIQAARLVYAEIGREVARAGFDSVTRRAVVSRQRQLGLMARACATALLLPAAAAGAAPMLALPAIRYLVDAAVSALPPIADASTPARPGGDRIGRTIDLFERVQQRRYAANAFNDSGLRPGAAVVFREG